VSSLVSKNVKRKKTKQVVYRIDEDIVNKFREICKQNGFKQVAIIENAMREVIEEVKNEK